MNLTQDGTAGMAEEDLLAKLGVKQDGKLCKCLQALIGPDKGPEDFHAAEADAAIAMMAMEGGSVVMAALHVLTSLARAGIASRILEESAVAAAKQSFINQLLGQILAGGQGGPGGLPGMPPGLQILELGPQDLKRADGAEDDPAAMKDGFL